MSTTMWGPALDAEVAYRRETLAADLHDARERARRTPRRRATGRSADRSRRADAPARRWWLPGSGTWHVAR